MNTGWPQFPWRRAPRADVGVDLGTTVTRIVVRGRGLVAEVPSVVALESRAEGRQAVAVGAEAWKMLGRAGGQTRVVQPVRGGSVADFEGAEHLLRDALGRTGSKAPLVLVTVPLDASDTERRALQALVRAAGGRDVHLVPAAMAAAVGAQLPVPAPVGSMIVSVGGGRTEIALVSLSGFVVRRSLKVAGETLDAAIVAWLRRHHGVMVGHPTAERIKTEVGAASAPERPLQTRVRARDLSTGAPRVIDVGAAEVAEAVREPVERIREAVLDALREAPPEVAADVLGSGILLVGGGARLGGLDQVIRDATGLPVLLADHPERATALGLGRILDDESLYADVVAEA